MIVFVVNSTITEKRSRTLRHLPPSAKLVYKVLETGGLLTQKDLIRETSLPSRTVRYAINRLKDEQFLIERHYFIDARQSLYGLNRPQQEVIAA